MESIVALIVDHKWWALSALAIGALVRFLKSDSPFPKILHIPPVPPAARVWLAIGLGIVAGVCDKIGSGTVWRDALVWGLSAAFAAVVGHDTLIESARDGRELPLPKFNRPPKPPATGSDDTIPPSTSNRGAPVALRKSATMGAIKLATAAVLTCFSLLLAACGWLTPNHVEDVGKIVACVIERKAEGETNEQTAHDCTKDDVTEVVDIFTAHQRAEREELARAGKLTVQGGSP